MINLRDVSYVRLGTADLEGATVFATEFLGLQVAERRRNAVYFRSDERSHTLCYVEGSTEQQAIGFEVSDTDSLSAAAGELEAIGHPVRLGSAEECALRQVEAFIAFRDPTGNSIELAVRPMHEGRRYFAARDAGITGFSHVGLCSTDRVRDEAFWTGICNARVSDRIGDAPLLRIDEVHHSIALFPSTTAGVQHVNHQVESVDDIMRSYRFMVDRGVKIVFGPGRHPTSSAQFLYFEGPDGMVFEYSSGVRSITDEPAHRARQFPFEPRGFCQWGAKPAIAEFRT